MDKMERALEVEDVLECHLVLSTATPVGTQVPRWAVFNSQGPYNHRNNLQQIAENDNTQTTSHPLANHPAPAE